MNNLHFATIKELATRFVDFLILIPSGYDATRNEARYLDKSSETVARFTGDRDWRGKWQMAAREKKSFDVFICDTLGASMQGIDYRYDGIHYTHLVRLPGKKVRLYRLALFSRNKLGEKLWNESKKYGVQQTSLF